MERASIFSSIKDIPMERQRILDRILSERLIPVVRVDRREQAMEVARALLEGGSHIVEITMTVPGAKEVIRELSQSLPNDVHIGAGTVLNPKMASVAVEAGARFLVSPSLNVDVIRLAHELQVLVIPGAMTPTEILAAWDAGAELVKVFPAGPLGGPQYIRAIRAPFPDIRLVPTGGVNPENAREYILAGAVAVGMGGELVDKGWVREGAFHRIAERTRIVLEALAASPNKA
jgi:2-dehydro-3-deoxyphosphogluconate aldolase/(4S)-4-hydroxy-2-oxoglutarate aldolase